MKELCQQVLRGAKSAPQAYHHDKQTDKIICLIRKNLVFLACSQLLGGSRGGDRARGHTNNIRLDEVA